MFIAATLFCRMSMRDKIDFAFDMFHDQNTGRMSKKNLDKCVLTSIKAMCRMVGICVADFMASPLSTITKLVPESYHRMLRSDYGDDGNISRDEFCKWVMGLPGFLTYIDKYTGGIDAFVAMQTVQKQVRECLKQFQRNGGDGPSMDVSMAMSLLQQCTCKLEKDTYEFISRGISDFDGHVSKRAFISACRAILAFGMVDKGQNLFLLDFQFRVS